MNLPEVMSVKDIQAYLGIGRSQAYKLVKSKNFPAVRVGKRILFSKKSFLKWFEKLEFENDIDDAG